MQHLVRLPAGPGSDPSALKITRISLSVVLSWSHSLVHSTCTAVRTTEQMFKKLLLVSLKSLMPLKVVANCSVHGLNSLGCSNICGKLILCKTEKFLQKLRNSFKDYSDVDLAESFKMGEFITHLGKHVFENEKWESRSSLMFVGCCCTGVSRLFGLCYNGAKGAIGI